MGSIHTKICSYDTDASSLSLSLSLCLCKPDSDWVRLGAWLRRRRGLIIIITEVVSIIKNLV